MKKLFSIIIPNFKYKVKLIVLLFIVHCSLFTVHCFSQGVGVNKTGAAADPAAILDASSTNQGILIPRMTDAQRQALKDPAIGLVIYNLTTNEINFYNDKGWQRLSGNSVSTESGTGAGPGGGIGISITKNTADASAILDVSSTDKGFLIPRNTQQSVTAVTGLIIYNSSTNQINFYDGSLWQVPCSSLIDNNKGTGAIGGGETINDTGLPADASAMLDVSSTTKGMLIPRMTSVYRDAIQSPAIGLIIYNTSDKSIEYWMGTAWYGLMFPPIASISGNTTICNGSTTLTASGGDTYLWSDNLGTNASVTVTPVVNTTYTVTVTTSCGMTTASIAVTVNDVTSPIAGINQVCPTQIVWNWSDVTSPVSYKCGTSTDYSSATDNGTNTSYTQTGLTCNTSYTLYVWAYNACGISSYTTLTDTTSACWKCGDPLTVTHTAGLVAPLTETVTYQTAYSNLTGSSKCWILQNLGATKQATSAGDTTNAAEGWYWEYDKKQGYNYNSATKTLSPTYAATYGKDKIWAKSEDPCNLLLNNNGLCGGWRIPTIQEWTNVNTNGGWTSSLSAYASDLKMHTAGGLTSGNSQWYGYIGMYWSCNGSGSSGNVAGCIYFMGVPGNGFSEVVGTVEQYGLTIRCIMD